MEYTIRKLAQLAGVSLRTLRYYDEIGLLRPSRVTDAGYRMYGPAEVDALQSILFYRELGVALGDIKSIMAAPAYRRLGALEAHLRLLLEKRRRMDAMIANVRKTIASEKGESDMTDEEKFEGLKERLLRENEEKYGDEARSLYGSEAVEQANAKFRGMSPQQYERMKALDAQLTQTLAAAVETKDPGGELAQQACALHKQWLMMSWSSYSPEAHAGLAQTYVDDARFAAYYERIAPGCAEFLRDAIRLYCRV